MTAAVWDPERCGGDAFGLCVAADVVSAGRRSVACGITGTVWDPGPSGNEYLDLCVAAGRVWVARRPVTPGVRAVNAAFDVTPADLVTALVTERRVVRPALGERSA